jgi:hypothetical protein
VIFIVAYDLKSPNDTEEDYKRVMDFIKTYSGWCHLEKSVWVIKSDEGASEIRDAIRANIYSDDVLFVGRLSGNWAGFNLGSERGGWLKPQEF